MAEEKEKTEEIKADSAEKPATTATEGAKTKKTKKKKEEAGTGTGTKLNFLFLGSLNQNNHMS